MVAPISVVLPSLSPITSSSEAASVATLIPATISPVVPVIPASLPAHSIAATVLEGETPVDVDTGESMTLYSPVSVYKDSKSQIIVQIPRGNSLIQSPRNYQAQASMPSLSIFEPVDQIEQPTQTQQQQHTKQMANGMRLNNSHSVLLSPISRHAKRSKHDFRQEFSTSIQVEATTTSTPFPHFSDIAWSNCHPEPLAVSRWLRITSTRKQYNFNIHWHKTPPTPGWGLSLIMCGCKTLFAPGLGSSPFLYFIFFTYVLVVTILWYLYFFGITRSRIYQESEACRVGYRKIWVSEDAIVEKIFLRLARWRC